MRAVPRFISLSALTLGACLLASPASAQFRLPKPRVPNPLNRATAQAGGPRAPTYDDRVIEITDARVTGLLKGLKAEQDQRPALEAAYKKNADDRAASEVALRDQGNAAVRWQLCIQAAAGVDTVAQRKLMDRFKAAQDRGDDAAVQKMRDSMMQVAMADGGRQSLAIAQAQAMAMQPGGKCGPPPGSQGPTAQPPVVAVPEPSLPLADSLQVLGAGAAGMTVEQYAVMQERVLAYLNSDDGRTGSLYAYSDAEMTVLRNKKAQLQRYQATLTDH